MLGAGHVGDHRVGAGGDQDGAGADLRAVGERDRVGAGDRRALGEDLDLVAVEDVGVDASRAARPRRARCRAGSASRTCSGRPSSRSGARPADPRRNGRRRRAVSWARSRGSRRCRRPVFLGDRDPGAVRGGDPRRAHPARAGADHEQVIVVARSFDRLRMPARSAPGSRDRSSAASSASSSALRHLLAELDAELVERVDAEQGGVGEGAVLVEGDQRAERRADRAGRAGSSSTAGRRDRRGADRRAARPPSAPRPGRSS